MDETSLTLSNFYAGTLHDFMNRPRNLMAHMRGSRRPLRRICDDLEKLRRYLDAKGNQTLEEIRQRLVAKDNLDFHHAHLSVLRLWLFVHIPATYSLAILAVVHVSAIYAYSSGAP